MATDKEAGWKLIPSFSSAVALSLSILRPSRSQTGQEEAAVGIDGAPISLARTGELRGTVALEWFSRE
jgi:hypothetical protein